MLAAAMGFGFCLGPGVGAMLYRCGVTPTVLLGVAAVGKLGGVVAVILLVPSMPPPASIRLSRSQSPEGGAADARAAAGALSKKPGAFDTLITPLLAPGIPPLLVIHAMVYCGFYMFVATFPIYMSKRFGVAADLYGWCVHNPHRKDSPPAMCLHETYVPLS
jgi:hypothetical protein